MIESRVYNGIATTVIVCDNIVVILSQSRYSFSLSEYFVLCRVSQIYIHRYIYAIYYCNVC